MKNLNSIPYPNRAILNEYQWQYISLINPAMNLEEALDFSFDRLISSVQNISEEKSVFKYQPDKWDIKTLVMHLSDTERIFLYRALSVARGVQDNLIEFDENKFAGNSQATQVLFSDIIEEYRVVTVGLKLFFQNLHSADAQRLGIANNHPVTPAIIGFMAAGHRLHHLNVLNERYLP